MSDLRRVTNPGVYTTGTLGTGGAYSIYNIIRTLRSE